MVLSLEYNTIKCLNYLIEDAARNMRLFKEKVNKQLLIFLKMKGLNSRNRQNVVVNKKKTTCRHIFIKLQDI